MSIVNITIEQSKPSLFARIIDTVGDVIIFVLLVSVVINAANGRLDWAQLHALLAIFIAVCKRE